MSGQRKNPFDLKEPENEPESQFLGGHLRSNHRQLRQIKKAKDYLIGFSRHLENNLDGTEFLVGNKVEVVHLSDETRLLEMNCTFSFNAGLQC
jgi:hypothetical protein